jgi:hypothetical protein
VFTSYKSPHLGNFDQRLESIMGDAAGSVWQEEYSVMVGAVGNTVHHLAEQICAPADLPMNHSPIQYVNAFATFTMGVPITEVENVAVRIVRSSGCLPIGMGLIDYFNPSIARQHRVQLEVPNH